MNRFVVFSILLGSLASLSLNAEGAGGIEFSQLVGNDLWPFPGGSNLPSKTGQISSFAGLGYGVDEEGNVGGGFGLVVDSRNLVLSNSPIGKPLAGFHAAYGGTLQGWQHRWGPLVALFTTRIGFGGADWDTVSSGHYSGFSLLGTAGAQLGVMVFPWFTVGVEAGAAGTITFVSGEPFLLGYAPTLGLRLLWGSF